MQQPQGSSPQNHPVLRSLSPRDIRLVRQVRGLTLAAVAKRAGFSISKLSNLEAGREHITPQYEVKLLRALWP